MLGIARADYGHSAPALPRSMVESYAKESGAKQAPGWAATKEESSRKAARSPAVRLSGSEPSKYPGSRGRTIFLIARYSERASLRAPRDGPGYGDAALETFARSVMVSNIAGAAAQIGGNTDESDGSMVGSQVADLEELRADMLDAVEAEMLAQGTDDGGMYETLEGIYSGIYSHMTNDVMGNNKSVTLTPVETTPAVVLAYELYGDAARGDEIAARNAVHNPLFVPPRALSILER